MARERAVRAPQLLSHLRYWLFSDSFRLSLNSRKSSLTVGKSNCVGLPRSTWGHISKNSKAQVGLQLLVKIQRTRKHPEDAHYVLHHFILHFPFKILPYQHIIGARSWATLCRFAHATLQPLVLLRASPRAVQKQQKDLRDDISSLVATEQGLLCYLSPPKVNFSGTVSWRHEDWD